MSSRTVWQTNPGRADETSDVVDVTVLRQVLDQAVRDPDHVVDAQEAAQDRLDLFPADTWIASLVDDRALDRDQRPTAVRRDRPSFQHKRGQVAWNVEPFGEMLAECVLLIVGPLPSAPHVESEVDRGQAALGFDQQLPVVAKPDLVERQLDDLNRGLRAPVSASAPKPGTATTTTGSNSAIALIAAIQPGFANGTSSAG